MQYIKPLDSIRGIAVLLVVLSHWVPISLFQSGAFIGVNTFFVLSGFLITNILLDNKIKAETSGYPKWGVIKNFFFRRVLRIFPIYFAVVIGLFILGEGRIANINEEIRYLLTFTINFHFVDLRYFGKFTAHLWSLAVEEQFYLVWPWLMIFLPRKYIPVAIGVFILTGFISQLFITNHFDYLATLTCLDAFGIGAFFSWIYTYKPRFIQKTYYWLGALALLYAIPTLLYFLGFIPFLLPTRTLISIFSVWLISYIVYRAQGNKPLKFSFLLNNSKLIFIGKISYGIYLYHFYIPFIAYRALNYLEKILPGSIKPYAFVFYSIGIFSFLILVSWLSWRFVEMPIMRYKKYFEYQTPAATPAPKNPAYTV